MESVTLQPIAYAENGFTDKFGIPRQSSDLSFMETRVIFTPAYRDRNALRGIEAFSHLWLIWGFSETNQTDWSPTVRPPRLGGNKRVGVFATRSPFRPNHLGLSSVRLLRIEDTPHDGMVLVVSGADLMNGTPIYDIKPYLSFSDSHPDAINGFAEATKDYCLNVIKADTIPSILTENEWQELTTILSQDPRPAYQSDPDRVYHLDWKQHHVAFQVENDHVVVVSIS